MKRLVSALLAAALLATLAPPVFAANVEEQLHALVEKIKAKMKTGEQTPETLAPEIAEFDALLAAHQSEKTDEVANILMMKAALYADVFGDAANTAALLKQVRADFPGTAAAKQAETVLADLATAPKVFREPLAEGAVFPPIDEKDVEGKPVSTAAYKGKIVLIDFWATWCPPCMREMPKLQKLHEEYHAKGFEIIGISRDHDQGQLTAFLKESHIPWQVYFDGEDKLSERFGVLAIPACYLLDRDGKVLAVNPHGSELTEALEKALK